MSLLQYVAANLYESLYRSEHGLYSQDVRCC